MSFFFVSFPLLSLSRAKNKNKKTNLGFRRARDRVHQRVPVHVQALPHNQRLDGAHLEAREGVRDAEDELAGVLRDLVEELGDEALLLDEFDVCEGAGRELDSLVEAVLAA